MKFKFGYIWSNFFYGKKFIFVSICTFTDTSHYDFSDANYVYKFILHALSWPDASTFCKSYLGPLATLANITSQKHWRHLQSYLSRVYPERDITIWIHQSNVSTQQSTKTVTVDGIVRGTVVFLNRYSGVIMSAMAFQITVVSIVCSIECSGNENIKVPCNWPLWGESTADRWIPLTKGQ